MSLVQTLQQLTMQTVEAAKPADIVMGEVLTINPLSIEIDQRDILPASFFHLTHAVKDYYVDIEVNHVTEERAGGSGYPQFASHDHDYIGRKKIMIYNGLKIGEKVLLLRRQGGQDYIILDRIFAPEVTGQWL